MTRVCTANTTTKKASGKKKMALMEVGAENSWWTPAFPSLYPDSWGNSSQNTEQNISMTFNSALSVAGIILLSIAGKILHKSINLGISVMFKWLNNDKPIEFQLLGTFIKHINKINICYYKYTLPTLLNFSWSQSTFWFKVWCFNPWNPILNPIFRINIQYTLWFYL